MRHFIITNWLSMSTQKPKNVLCEAVSQLRQVVGKSQMKFAAQMDWHIVTLARYETTRPPKGRALAQLWRVAQEHGQHGLARVFLGGFQAEIGQQVYAAPPGFEAAMYAFTEVLQPGQYYEKKREKILKLLEPEIEKAKVVFAAMKLARNLAPHEIVAVSEKRKNR